MADAVREFTDTHTHIIHTHLLYIERMHSYHDTDRCTNTVATQQVTANTRVGVDDTATQRCTIQVH